MLDGALAIEQTAKDGLAQSLRIGASTTIGNDVLPKLLGQFLQQQHDQSSAWQSHILIGNTEAICDAVAAFELDIGLIEGPSHQPMLTVTPWLQDELLVVCAPDYPLVSGMTGADAGSAATSLDALREAVWLLREQGSGTRETTDHLLLPHLHSYRRSIVMGSSQAIKQAAAEGLGLACLSQWVVGDFIAAGRLQAVNTPLPRMTRQCYLVMHQDKRLTTALKRFLRQAALCSNLRMVIPKAEPAR
jgi:DNA-binding transcriptional LysR family regulator